MKPTSTRPDECAFELRDYMRVCLHSHMLPEHIQLLDETRLLLLHTL